MARCSATKPDGSSCERIVGASQAYCYAHDPFNAEKRRRDAAKAGKSTPNGELREVKGLLKKLIQQVLSGELETSRAVICVPHGRAIYASGSRPADRDPQIPLCHR